MTNISFLATAVCLLIGVVLTCSTSSCAWIKEHPQQAEAIEEAIEEIVEDAAEAAIKAGTGVSVDIELDPVFDALLDDLEEKERLPQPMVIIPKPKPTVSL